ncbi:MAG TPA: DUF6084 family protein [Blastocatellia bacterium]|nr:DUF6084 family protein [Blastocatellia bacterium]
MPDLQFEVEGAEAIQFASVPTLAFKLRVSNMVAKETINTIVLRAQIMIEPGRRRYTAADQPRLADLFGEPDRWGQTLRPMLWMHLSVTVPTFMGTVAVDVPAPCTFDFNVAATKYFAGLEGGDVPLNFLFSGTVFYESGEGALQVNQIPWDKEARYRLPLVVWNQMMDYYYPNSAWLCLRRDVFERLYHYKVRRGFPTFEQALESILPDEHEFEPEDDDSAEDRAIKPDGPERLH